MEVLIKQSIIAVIITAIVGVCGGSLGLKPPTGGNLTTTAAGEQEKILPGDREVRKKLWMVGWTVQDTEQIF